MSKATNSMIKLCQKIAQLLDLEEPNYNDFAEIKEFIDEWIEDYNYYKENR